MSFRDREMHIARRLFFNRLAYSIGMTALVRVIYIGGDNESICRNNILELVVDCNWTGLLINMMCCSGEKNSCGIKRLITFPRNKVFASHLWNYIRRRVIYFSCILHIEIIINVLV